MKKRDPNQMDLFAMTNPEYPETPAPETKPEPSTTPSEPTQPPAPAFEPDMTTDSPETDSTFDPSSWDTGETDLMTSPEVTPVASLPDSTTEPGIDDDFALFESDPFFNPAIAAPQSRPPRATPPPAPLAEERLLEQIVQKGTPDTETPIESDLDRTRQELEELRNRCATLEAERDTARREADKERQLRAEAVRTRPLALLKPTPQELQAERNDFRKGPSPSRRSLYLTAPAILILCFLAYSLGRRQAPESVAIMEPVVAPPKMETLPLPIPPSVREQPVAAWPSFEGAGYRVTGDNAARRIVFNYGTFSRGTQLSEAAQRDLARIAAAFKANIASFRIEVEGHTDATPVRSSHAFADNHELAMARATAAMEFLTSKGGLPADAITAKAAGDKNPPYPGATPDDQKKNRTVVLNITRR